jgi:hypothetical protein
VPPCRCPEAREIAAPSKTKIHDTSVTAFAGGELEIAGPDRIVVRDLQGREVVFRKRP